MVIASLYGPFDNLTGYIHPEYGRSTRFLSETQVLGIAHRLTQEIVTSGRKLIVVAESGATPLARLCERLLARSGRGAEIRWEYVKIPREIRCVEPVIAHYCSSEERVRLQELFDDGTFTRSLPHETFCKPGDLSCVLETIAAQQASSISRPSHAALSTTDFGRMLARPFLYFDEYLDSGTTLWNAHQFFSLFTPINFKTLSYFVFVDRPADHPLIAAALNSRTEKERCFDEGAYPFENRLDLVGHFFFSFDDAFGKVTIDALTKEFPARDSDENFRETLAAAAHGIAADARAQTRLPAVRERLCDDDGARFLLARLERTHGTRVHAEFLWQLFEMYGPIWSPLPDEFHREFLHAFSTCDAAADAIAQDPLLREQYRAARRSVIGEAAHACAQRYDEWNARMNALLEVTDGPETHP